MNKGRIIFVFVFLILLIIGFIIYFVFGDHRKECAAFNFSNLPFDTNYFNKNLTYTNKYDTVTLVPSRIEFSKLDYTGNNGLVFTDCFQYADFKFNDVQNNEIVFRFYSKEEYTQENLNLEVFLNFDNNWFSDYDDLKNLQKNENSIYYNTFTNPKNLNYIQFIKIENFRITQIQPRFGYKWSLYKVGDSVVK